MKATINIRTNCGGGYTSNWSGLFITIPGDCTPPSNLNADNITFTSAKVSWNGCGILHDETFELRYRNSSISSDPSWNTIQTWNQYVNLSDLTLGSDYIVQVRSYCDGEWTDWSDTLIFSTIPVTCFVPTDLTVSSIVPTGANLTWNQAGVSSAWFVEYGTSPDFSTYAQQDADSTSLSLTGLYASTTYYVRVVNDCGTSEISSLSETASFTTLELCPVPTDLTVSNIGSYGAEISWSQPGDGSHWYVEYSTSPEFEASSTHSKLVETMMVTLTDLNVNTTYYVRVRNYCGNSGTSAWVTTNFTTEIGIALIVEIGNYGNTTLYLPTYTGTKYSMTEQIYTAAEMVRRAKFTALHSITTVVLSLATSTSIWLIRIRTPSAR